MATATLPITGAWWGTGANSGWFAAEYIQCGQDGSNFRSKIAISTAGLTIVNTSRLVLEVQVYSKSSPFGLEAILTKDNTILANDCQNRYAGAASDTLNSAAIDRSFAYADAECTTPLTTDTGIDLAIGSKFYLLFETAQLEQEQTYYLYFIRNLRDGYSGSGWVEAYTAAIVPTLIYTNYTACTAPAWLTVTPQIYEDVLRLEWGGAEPGQSNPITGYQIRARYSDDGVAWADWVDLASTDQTFYELGTDVERGAYLAFAVRAMGQAGEEYASLWRVPEDAVARKNRIPPVPAQPLPEAALVNSGAEVTISWTASEDPDGQECSYIVRKNTADGWVEVARRQDTHFSEVCTEEPGQTIQYSVTAVDELGAESEPAFCGVITVNSPPVAPAQVTLDKYEYSPGESVTVSWSGAEDVDGNLATVYIYAVPEGTQEHIQVASIRYNIFSQVPGSGSESFQPDQLEYLQKMKVAVQTEDRLGARSPFAYSGSLLRNDTPHAHIFEDGLPGSFVPRIGQGRYMPYVRVNGQWLRHPGNR